MDKLKSVLSGEEGRTQDRTILQAANEASTLGWGTRVKGFVGCFVIGCVCTLLGVCVLFIPKIGITLFIVFYSLGNVCSLCSTMFLMGPVKQLKRMCDKTRALATTIMLTCLVLTLCAAFWWKNFGLALLFCILQLLAFAWLDMGFAKRQQILKIHNSNGPTPSPSTLTLTPPIPSTWTRNDGQANRCTRASH
ncbi:SFT2 domain containing 2a isoform X1 [Gadus chalcogrammus]|uniref:SFT2 domain containing 2a isoform X1 n=1 Tax=Gadus chalcogrammus TaxID=1042646 RepID=UPI0024C4B50B|nr:SFT2 domain containing 2a isoform X1 [Gadus chalcogrammus]